jgi:proteasome assembly chaperone 3
MPNSPQLHVPLSTHLPSAPTTTHDDSPSEESTDLLPLAHFTATTILGGTLSSIDTLGQLLATQLASAIIVRDTEEKRMLVLGLGLDLDTATKLGEDGFAELVGGCLDVL